MVGVDTVPSHGRTGADEADCERRRDEHAFCQPMVSKTRGTLVPRYA